ncbi:ATP-dependent DNA ligase [Cenarchaeum symbiosum A]|nr:ATP-dependent DNA ligase [Cenarchaeum symbiosum A]
MESTAKRLELTGILEELLRETPHEVIAQIVYLIQGKLRPEFEGIELGVAEKLAVRAVSKSSGMPAARIEAAYRRDGDLGRAASSILEQKTQTTFLAEEITVERVYDTLMRIARLEGARSQDMKMRHISSLLNDASPRDACYILKLILGTLRLGIAENTVMDALAAAFTGSKSNRPELERAYNVSSDLGRVAEAVSSGGLEAVRGFAVAVFSPIRPMLADRVRSESEALEKMGAGLAAEYKLDGERVQVHLSGGRVELFSRSLENITAYYPDIVERIPGRLRAREAVLEAEAVAVNEETGEFLPFQELMHRRRKYDIDKAVMRYPITVNFFDILYLDGRDCLGISYSERRALLEGVVDEDSFARCVPVSTIPDESALEDSLENSINAGCEGLMLKLPDAPYRAGSRGGYWLKLKREYRNELGDSLDLVIIGAFFGKGRRTGRYGTLLLATYDDSRDTFPSICKVGTGFTDEDLDQLYQLLSPRVTLKRNPRIDSGMEADVWFDPEVVMEVVASEITLSPVHKTALDSVRKGAGLALRFPKFTGKLRTEKTAEDASTDQEVIALYKSQKKVVPDGQPGV